ncbi:hypothetical protein HYV50_05055 [Candidatus Pacearchaeota archaeon]|nr:hypothetical protein [Candidatus Pacearchaeota archaeon]
MKAKYVIIGLFIAVLIFFLVKPNITGNVIATGSYDEFAQCLKNNGVKMYGAYWCPHCNNQKAMFESSWKYINYVECSLPNNAGQTQVCNNAGIEAYPTWEFGNGKRMTGELSLEQLSQNSGCGLPQ